MTFNSALGCGANPNIIYPLGNSSIVGRIAATGAGGPHAPSAICGVAISFDKDGNTLSYDNDGPSGQSPFDITYDGENRPVSVTRGGVVTNYAYGPAHSAQKWAPLLRHSYAPYLNGANGLWPSALSNAP